MRPCTIVFQKPGFYLKIVELLLSFIGLVLLVQWRDVLRVYYFSYSMEILTVLVTAGYFYILTIFVIVYILDETHHVLEILFLGPGVVLNFVTMGFFMYTYFQKEGSPENVNGTVATFFCMLSATCGLSMAVDFVREVKLGNLDDDFFGY